MHPRFTSRSRASQYALVAAAVAVLLVLAACGSNAGAASNSTSSSDSKASALKYTRCMRDHGINVSDPQVSTNGNGGFSVKISGNGSQGVNPDSAQFQQAQNACKKYLPNGGQLSPQQQAQFQQKALAFARCMRAHGVDVPDPQGSALRLPNSINPDDPHVQQAQKACESILGNPSGSGPSTSKGGSG